MYPDLRRMLSRRGRRSIMMSNSQFTVTWLHVSWIGIQWVVSITRRKRIPPSLSASRAAYDNLEQLLNRYFNHQATIQMHAVKLTQKLEVYCCYVLWRYFHYCSQSKLCLLLRHKDVFWHYLCKIQELQWKNKENVKTSSKNCTSSSVLFPTRELSKAQEGMLLS